MARTNDSRDYSGIFDKPDGPLVILVFGDSNTDGIGGSDSTLLTKNSNVHVYATTGSGTWNPSDLEWRDVNPNAALVSDYLSLPTDEPYVGILRNANGSMGYTMADRLQQRTGRDVYLFVVHQGGKTTEYYQSGGGAGKEGMNAIDLHLPTALASIPGSPTKVDYVMISIGGNDVNTGISDDDFVTNWEAMYAHLISEGYIEEGYTQTFQMEMPLSFAPYTPGAWHGYELLANRQKPDVHFLSSAGYDTSDTVHYVPAAMNSMGKISADTALLGNKPTHFVSPFLKSLPSSYGTLPALLNAVAEDAFSVSAITVKNCWTDPIADILASANMTVDPDTGVMTLNYDGTYRVAFSMSFKGTTGDYLFAVVRNADVLGFVGATAYVESASHTASCSAEAFVTLEAGDEIRLKYLSLTGAKTATITTCTFTACLIDQPLS